MRNSVLLTIAIALISVARPAAAVSLTPAVKKDVQCFLLFAAAVGTAKDDKTRQAAGFGAMYFLGRLDVASPGLNIVEAVRQEAKALEGNPKATEIGAACDTALRNRGSDLIDIGQQLKQAKN